MAGAEVGMVEKKQGRFTFPERDPVTGLIIDNVLEAERQQVKGLQNVFSINGNLQISLFCVYFLLLFVSTCFSSIQMRFASVHSDSNIRK